MRSFVIAAIVAAALACGRETTRKLEIQVQPAEVTLRPRATQGFTLVPADTHVSWSIAESNGGSVSQDGLYTAPAYSGDFHVVATSVADASAKGEATAHVDSSIVVTVSSSTSADACQPTKLQAVVSGPTTDTAVVWSAPASCGTITENGTFTSARGSGSCIVTATSHADPGKIASIDVNVVERIIRVDVGPPSFTVALIGAQTVTADVTTTCGTFAAGQ